MKNNLKKTFLFILIVVCIVLIVKNIVYKNIILLVLTFSSFYLGKICGHKKDAETKLTTTKYEKTEIQPTSSKIPQEFKDEQKRFQELNKQEDWQINE